MAGGNRALLRARRNYKGEADRWRALGLFGTGSYFTDISTDKSECRITNSPQVMYT
jgi:hypothetical protein